VINLNQDFSIFVFYGEWIRCYGEAEDTWNRITTLANKAKLSWTFARTGDNCIPTEESNNFSEVDVFNDRIRDLFKIKYSITITNKIVASTF
jgi:hypothetical protein